MKQEEKITAENFERLFGIKNVCEARVIVEGKDGRLFGGKIDGYPCGGGLYEMLCDNGDDIVIHYDSIKEVIMLPETKAYHEKMYDHFNKTYKHLHSDVKYLFTGEISK